MKKQEKVKLLVWGDSPAVSTGFAQLVRGIFNNLPKDKYDIDMIGINDSGGYKDPTKYPYRIFPAQPGSRNSGDVYGRERLVAGLLNKDPEVIPPWDIIFTVNDPFILEQPMPVLNAGTLDVIKQTQELYRRQLPPEWLFKTVSYWPIDSEIKPNWLERAIAVCDFPVAYAQYGKSMILKSNLENGSKYPHLQHTPIIYHGVNLQSFNYVQDRSEVKAFRKEFFQGRVKDDMFLIIAVARNQQRKDLPRTLKIFKEFLKRRPNSYLYIHAQETDAWGSLREYGHQLGLEYEREWGVPGRFNASKGYPLEVLNLIYNTADCVLSTTLSEGFGFYNMEGFATKTPIVAPNNSTHPELFNFDTNEDITDLDMIYTKLRGIPMQCGTGKSLWATYGPTDFERLRPLTSVEDGIKKLLWIYDNPDKTQVITDNAYQWVQDYDWSKIAMQWDTLFDAVMTTLNAERSKITKERKQQGVAIPEPIMENKPEKPVETPLVA